MEPRNFDHRIDKVRYRVYKIHVKNKVGTVEANSLLYVVYKSLHTCTIYTTC